jgi:hypothetical protein
MFSELKSTQAAAHLMKRAGGTMNSMVLIKMLYLSDRLSIFRRGRAITGDNYRSMEFGPVLSKVHDLITEQPSPNDRAIWRKYISERVNWKVNLIDDPGEGALSEGERQILDEIFNDYKTFLNRPFDLAEKLHAEFPEVIEIEKGKQQPLTVKDILEANHVSDEEKNAILRDLETLRELDGLLVAW